MATKNAVGNSLTGSTGSGAFVGATSPTLVTPALGTPASGDLSNCTNKGVSAVSFNAQRSTNQNLTRLVYTKVQCDTENWDTGSLYDNATNYRFQPTVAGKYYFLGVVAFLSMASGNNCIARLDKNGSAAGYNAAVLSAAGSPYLQVGMLITMNGSSDYVELSAYHDNAADRNAAATDTKFMGWRVE